MTPTSAPDYLYVVEWDDSVHRPPYTVMHDITLNQGVTREAFEKFMAEKGFDGVGQVRTRAGAVAAQYLLVDTTGDSPERVEELDLALAGFGERTSVAKYRVVARWEREN